MTDQTVEPPSRDSVPSATPAGGTADVSEFVGGLWGRAVWVGSTHILFFWATLVVALSYVPLWIALIFSILNGVAIALLFAIAHDCVHDAFVPNKTANKWFGRLTFIPHGHAASLWELGHNRLHHGRTNLKGYDYAWAPMSLSEYREAGWFRRAMQHLYRSPIGAGPYYAIEIWLAKMVLPLAKEARSNWRDHMFDIVFMWAGFIGLIALMPVIADAFGSTRPLWLIYVLGLIIPLVVWNYVLGFVFYVHHTNPKIPWFDDIKEWSFYRGIIAGTTQALLKVHVFTILKNALAHTAHHAHPKIPIYLLPQAQDRLVDHYGSVIQRFNLSFLGYLDICRRCKLYDFERNCWVDFKGQETARPIMHGKLPPEPLA